MCSSRCDRGWCTLQQESTRAIMVTSVLGARALLLLLCACRHAMPWCLSAWSLCRCIKTQRSAQDSSCTAQLQLHTQALLVSRHSPLPRAADQVTLRCVLISSCSCTPCHENQLLRLSLLVLLLLGSRYQAEAAFAAAAVAQARTCAAAQALDHPAAHPR